MKLIIVSILSLILVGCIAFDGAYTRDPNIKLNQAYQLMNLQERASLAEKLGLEALAQYNKKKDSHGIANSHYFLGVFYQSPVYRSNKDYYVKQASYDSTSTKSIFHYKKAVMAYEVTNDFRGITKTIFEMGNSYELDGDIQSACFNYRKALDIYQKNKKSFMEMDYSQNSLNASYETMIENYIKGKCVSSVF